MNVERNEELFNELVTRLNALDERPNQLEAARIFVDLADFIEDIYEEGFEAGRNSIINMN